MKYLYLIFLILIVLFCSGSLRFEQNISYQPNVDRLEDIFKAYLPLNEGILFTKVPRGLVVSIDEKWLFNEGEARIKESSLCILDIIASLLQKLPNYCVIENHTNDNVFENSYYNEDWELSISRSANIAEYLIKYQQLRPERIFALGYGEFMPFKDNVSPQKGFDNRIDFVIIEYEAKR